jgi:NADH dehydrogenase (ubiquinone) Fe-S protein 6
MWTVLPATFRHHQAQNASDFTQRDRCSTTITTRPKMLSRTLRAVPRRMPVLRSAYSTANDNPVPANDPKAREPRSPVSATNATPTSSEGSMDRVLQESVEAGEQMRTMQAPNRKGIWSRSQAPREKAMVGPRFEQTIMEDQVRTTGWARK